jgi:hypothetical protein
MSNKLQALLISQLTKYGSVKLILPDDIVLEIGINQIGQGGELINTPDYAWIIASRDNCMAVLDSCTCGVRFVDKKNVVFEDTIINQEGETVRHLDVV